MRIGKLTGCLLACLLLFLTGCSGGKEKEAVDLVREKLDGAHSFAIEDRYTDLGIQGFEEKISQTTAEDGSFRFDYSVKRWIHTAEYEMTSDAVFYYRYEGDDFVCYRSTDGGISRNVMTEEGRKDLERSHIRTVGGFAFLPRALTDFRETTGEEGGGERTFAFAVALKDLENTGSFLSSFCDRVFDSFGRSLYPEPGLTIRGTLVTDADLCPLRISYDFTELEPHVLSAVTWSSDPLGEIVLLFECSFDLDLPEHVEIPDVFLETEHADA